ncbi:MAG: HAD family hydrolase [Anaerolineae bacterium]|nr:HAD family hydrolase [Anaerolineae bacterium]MCO5206974.1 HAD family hydrolase [Anaerolineae bacterium]
MTQADRAWALVCQYVQDAGLRRHMRSVGVAMRFYADQLGEDADYWEAIGRIHDFDWEIHPNLNEHPMLGAPILRENGWDDETIRIIMSHYEGGTGVAPEKPVDFALLACDEITGLIIASALVRPNRNILDVQLKSVRKKWNTRRFAAGVDRDHVEQATADFSRVCFGEQLDLWTHVGNVLSAMQGAAADLELDGRLADGGG